MFKNWLVTKIRPFLQTDRADLNLTMGVSVLAGALVAASAGGVVRLMAGLFLVFIAPGYALIASLYPTSNTASYLWRFCTSIGMSLGIVSLIGLATAFSVGVRAGSAYLVLLLWVCCMSLIAAAIRLTQPRSERHGIHVSSLTDWRKPLREIKVVRYIQLMAVFMVLLALIRLLVITNTVAPQYLEFYLLGDGQHLGNYPTSVLPGQVVKMTVGIANHEQETLAYDLHYRFDEGEAILLARLTLDHGQRWQSELGFTAPELAGSTQLTLWISRPGEAAPLRKLHLWLNVTGD